MYRSLPALIAALVLAAPAHAYERLPRQLAGLSPADFARQVEIAEDPKASAIVLSTKEGYTRGRALDGAHASDVHLRALVDRNSGRVTWQVWHDLINVRGHKMVTAVDYMAGGTLRSVKPFIVEHSLTQCPPTDSAGSCNQVTRIGFELPEQTVREIAAAYDAGSREPWRLRFKDAKGRDVTGGLAPAEAAGLVQALDAWRGEAVARHQSR